MTETVKQSNIDSPNARRLILNLLGVIDGGLLGVADALRACALFDITENSVRVALARLTQSGLVELAERGVYRLGPQRRRLQEETALWRTVAQRLRPWSGQWIAAATGGLPRSDRKDLRGRERAFSILGLRELDCGLHIRPDNLSGGVDDVRRRLTALDVSAQTAVFLASDFDASRQERALGLWDGAGLLAQYQSVTANLEDWLGRSGALAPEVAARESFLLGDDAIRRIVFDPMLPAPLVDEAERGRFIETVERFNARGRSIWVEFLGGAQQRN